MIKKMTSGKASGPDAIPAEVCKTGGEAIRNQLASLFQTMWIQERLPQEFRDATIIHIYKQKGNRQSCDNQRGISLLSTAAKILYRVLLNLNDCWSKVSSPLRANAASAQVVEQPTRYLSPASSRIRLPERGLPYSQSGRTLENHGNIRVTKHVHRNRPPIP